MSDVDFEAANAQYHAAESQVASARAQLAAAAEQAGRTTVVAPLTGVVSERTVNEGEAVSVNQALLTIVNADTLELAGQIPVRQVALVKAGQPVTFTLDAYPGQEFSGRVARLDPVADPATRQVGAALELPNPGHRLVPGQFVTGRVVTANVGRALQVPRAAIRVEGDKSYVLAVENDTLVRRDVTTGATDTSSGMVVLNSGLREGETVVTSPATGLQPGARVRVTQASAGATGS
jgi:RND family efflux transporter MFP subunit